MITTASGWIAATPGSFLRDAKTHDDFPFSREISVEKRFTKRSCVSFFGRVQKGGLDMSADDFRLTEATCTKESQIIIPGNLSLPTTRHRRLATAKQYRAAGFLAG